MKKHIAKNIIIALLPVRRYKVLYCRFVCVNTPQLPLQEKQSDNRFWLGEGCIVFFRNLYRFFPAVVWKACKEDALGFPYFYSPMHMGCNTAEKNGDSRRRWHTDHSHR